MIYLCSIQLFRCTSLYTHTAACTVCIVLAIEGVAAVQTELGIMSDMLDIVALHLFKLSSRV